jgi:hypothetical protein
MQQCYMPCGRRNNNSPATSYPQTMNLTNTGTAALTFTVAVNGDFAQTNDCPASLAPSASCTFTWTFTPTTGGTRTRSLVLVSNSYNSPQSVSLASTGDVAQATTSATSLTFGTQGLNDTSAAKKVTLTNKNSTAITLFGNTITGTNASAFAISATTCSSRC